MVARGLWGRPYVLLVQDVWPDSIFASGFLTGAVGSVARRSLNFFVNLTYRWADHVAVTSPGMVDLLASRGVPRKKFSVAHNWVEEKAIMDPDWSAVARLRESWGVVSDDFVLMMYAGNHGQAQGLEPVVEVFAGFPLGAGCHLVLIGEGVAKSGLVETARGHPAIHFMSPVPRSEMTALMSASDAQLVSLAGRPLFAVTMPSKVQSILAAGLSDPGLRGGRLCAGPLRRGGARRDARRSAGTT